PGAHAEARIRATAEAAWTPRSVNERCINASSWGDEIGNSTPAVGEVEVPGNSVQNHRSPRPSAQGSAEIQHNNGSAGSRAQDLAVKGRTHCQPSYRPYRDLDIYGVGQPPSTSGGGT